jgi:hypothetical protein
MNAGVTSLLAAAPEACDMDERAAENWSFTFAERCDPDSNGLVVSFGPAINC